MTTTINRTVHTIGTRQEWLARRLDLLAAEKELTKRSDELAQQRQELPWVRVDKNYVFDTGEGKRRLAELFDGRSQCHRPWADDPGGGLRFR